MALEKKSNENMRPFYGREAELRRLKELENKKTSSLVVISR